MDSPPLRVTRLPGAPPRRAGRTWTEGQAETLTDYTAAQAAALRGDPGYRVETLTAPAAPLAEGNPSRGRKLKADH